ncbi:lipopolysaccharide heptosyltransferase II [Methyloradius palustris]|uniref:lipopolysaccharide heptosyltransferase II n=1 Tax=Methyloradius palustris TaxID=2778876 RepID=A0A8D5G9H1_9PROT|nr:lipopolysaccharide heptosyltransferase II [Methyloradius palustris]BCM25551.1 lipopolysaccharide heptosyltransferase II [Methyloradius palustris]
MSAPKILIFGPAWVGDMVLAQSLFKVLKAKHPDCIIDVAAPAWTMPLLERMPEVNQGIVLSFKHGELALWQRIQFGRTLKNQGYSQAILLTNSFKSGIIPFAAGIPRRTSFLGEMRYGLINDIRPLDKTRLVRTVDRFVALGLDKGVTIAEIPNPTLIADKTKALQALEKLNAPAQGKILGLCPGAEYGEAKRWPAEYYAEVANEALNKGWQVWLFGSEKDMPVTAQINQLTQNKCLDLGGKTKLGEAIDLMSLCHTVISNDSGLMHIAAALNKPLVAIYGSSDPHHTPPMSAKTTVFYLGLKCSPCFERVCPLGHLNCLREIKPEQLSNVLSRN